MARRSQRRRRLWDAYCFPGFRPERTVRGIFGDPKARVITLKRRSKKRLAAGAGAERTGGKDHTGARVACGKVKRERLDFLADNPLYTKRFAYYVGRRCRAATIKDVAEELALDWAPVTA